MVDRPNSYDVAMVPERSAEALAGGGSAKARSGRVATLHAVAALAGCSTATVSKALNGLPVSAENLGRVRAAAEKLGYVPNIAGRNIRGGRTMTIGVVMNLDVHPQLEILELLSSTIADMEAADYTVMVSIRAGDIDVDVLLRRFLKHRVDGLFFWNARPASSLGWYQRAAIPVLAVAFRDDACADLPLVTADGGPAYRQMLDALRSHGHVVIGEMLSGREVHDHRRMASGSGMEWQRLDVGFDIDSVAACVRQIAASSTGPTAIMAPYPTALQVLAVCEELGLRIPKDLSVVSTTDGAGAALLRTPLSSIRTDFGQIGRVAARAMLDGIGGGAIQDRELPDSVTWIDRGSIGPVCNS